MTVLLEISNLTAGYGKAKVLRDVSLAIDAGESVAMIGRNGAGKSTLLLSLFGLAQLHSGQVTVAGQRLASNRRARMATCGLALTPQGRRIITQLTVQENLILGTAAGRTGPWDLDSVYELFPVLKERARKPGSALSGGQQQMLAIARALVARPRVLLLDEPSQGLAPFVLERLAISFGQLQEAGITLLVVEQNLSFARRCTTRLYAMAQGTVRYSGGWDEFAATPDLLETYL